MAWTYSQDFTLERDQVRFLIQDVQVARPLCSDAEIAWVVSQAANVYQAAAMCCEVLVARAGNISQKSVADLKLRYSPDFYRGLAMTLRLQGSGHQVPFAGGISIADKQTLQTDSDAVQPTVFTREFDNPRATQPSPGGNTQNPLTGTP